MTQKAHRDSRTRHAAEIRRSLRRLAALTLVCFVAVLLVVGQAAADRTGPADAVDKNGRGDSLVSIDEPGPTERTDGRTRLPGADVADASFREKTLLAFAGVVLATVLLAVLGVRSPSLFRSGGTSRGDRSTGTTAPQRPGALESRREDARSDEEVVRRLLERHDGQLRQSAIVEETEWSKAKVSRLLGAMADDGEIVKVSVGRQNIIYLDGREPSIAKSHDR
ncbi:DUF7343 domain-containing protein [Halobellus sp. GM3]|uniref:DUF7343 domain-containing protein n=1 Tax=Halobellus sp. GM3 TaxID=3458410 RepID=UPI00403DFE8D